MKKLLILTMIALASTTTFAQSIEQHTNHSEEQLSITTHEEQVAQKTREQVLQELIQARKDGTMDKLNELYKGGQ